MDEVVTASGGSTLGSASRGREAEPDRVRARHRVSGVRVGLDGHVAACEWWGRRDGWSGWAHEGCCSGGTWTGGCVGGWRDRGVVGPDRAVVVVARRWTVGMDGSDSFRRLRPSGGQVGGESFLLGMEVTSLSISAAQ